MSPKRRDVLALAAIVVVAGGLAAVATFAAHAAGSDPAPVTVTSVSTEIVIADRPVPTPAPVTKTITVTVTPTSRPAAMAGTFGNGSFKVGSDVRAGYYATAGPAAGVRTGCVWKRTGPTGRVITQGTAFGPITIIVRDGELVTATGCRQWSRR